MDSKGGQQIPKATMNTYLKQKFGKTKLSTEFIEGILKLSKTYITTIANKANEICTNQNKKTISLDHLYKSIEVCCNYKQHFNLSEQMQELKKVQQEVKQQVLHKQQIKLNIQKSYDEMTKQKAQQQPLIKRELSAIMMRNTINHETFKKEQEDENYEDMNNDEQQQEQAA